MTTNGEWLDYLAHNAPDELAAWFDAEHVETEERALDGDTDALVRECAELQAQVYELTAERDEWKAKAGEIQQMLDWEEWPDGGEINLERAWVNHMRTIEQLQGQVKELTAERDKLKELNGYHSVQYELASEDCDRLQAQVDAKDNCIENIMQTLHETQARASNLADDLLTANNERDNWKASCEDWKKHARAAENACYETMLEREEYRKLFGMALDWAHEITMLESSVDEGMA